VLECCLFSPMGAFQLNCKLKRIFYSSASESTGISRGGNEGMAGKGGRDTGRIASQQELSLPFPAREKFFSNSATSRVTLSPSVPRMPVVISSVPQTSSEPRSNRIIPRGATTSPAPIHYARLRDDSPSLYLPVASTPRVVATIPRSAGYRISLVWKLRKLPRSHSSSIVPRAFLLIILHNRRLVEESYSRLK